MLKMSSTWSAKQVAKMFAMGKLQFDNIIQRSYVWEDKRKSDLIHSMIEGYPIPPFYARRIDGKTYDFLDGKQRMSAIAGFINGEYALKDIKPIIYTDDYENEIEDDLSGMFFNELPENIQDAIKDYSLTIYYYDEISDAQVRELFRKLNNGKPLSAKEKNIANCTDIRNISGIGEHQLFKLMFNEKGMEQRKYIPIIMKVWMMLNKDINDISFESSKFNEVMETTTTTEDEREEIVELFDYLMEVIEIVKDASTKATVKKILTETNFVSLVPYISEAKESGVKAENFADFLISLFEDGTVSAEYVDASSAGSAKNGSVKKRDTEIAKKYNTFFAEDEASETEEVEDVDEDSNNAESEKEGGDAYDVAGNDDVADWYEDDVTDYRVA